MNLDDAVDEVGTMTVIELVGDGAIDTSTPFGAMVSEVLPLPLPPNSGLSIGERVTMLVADLAADGLEGFERIILAGQELLVLDALAESGVKQEVFVALPAWTPSDTTRRIAANAPAGLSVETITVPTYPDGNVSPTDTLLVLCGFDGGAGMWLIPQTGRSVVEFYRSQLLYETILLDPVGLPVHRRARLFGAVGGRTVDRALSFTSADRLEA